VWLDHRVCQSLQAKQLASQEGVVAALDVFDNRGERTGRLLLGGRIFPVGGADRIT
jgi:hypothetical protein